MMQTTHIHHHHTCPIR